MIWNLRSSLSYDHLQESSLFSEVSEQLHVGGVDFLVFVFFV